MYDDFWDGFEAECAASGMMMTKVPTCMKKLLTILGYDSAWSYKSVTEEKLREAEDYIEKSHRKAADELDEYKDIRPFKFLPGHKALIYGIGNELNESQARKKPKINNKKSNVVLSEKEVQMSLLFQMSAFTKKLGLIADWSSAITDSNYSATESAPFCTCTVLCPICHSSFVVRYDKHWKNSNLCKHMRQHKDPSKQPTSKTSATVSAASKSRNTHINMSKTPESNIQIYEDVQVLDHGDLDEFITYEDLDEND